MNDINDDDDNGKDNGVAQLQKQPEPSHHSPTSYIPGRIFDDHMIENKFTSTGTKQ